MTWRTVLAFISGGLSLSFLIQAPDRESVFEALYSGTLAALNKQLNDLPNSSRAYKAALQMRKAGIMHRPSEKLDLFRQGRIALDSCISKHPQDAELHLLRLIIQENAPAIVHYDSSVNQDADLLKEKYDKLEPSLKKQINTYQAKSPALKKRMR